MAENWYLKTKCQNLIWNLEKQEKTQVEEMQEIQATSRTSRIQRTIVYIIIVIYSYFLRIQDSIPKYVKAATLTIQKTIRATRNIGRTSWINIKKEMRTVQELLRTRQGNLRNQSYRSYISSSDHSTTQ